MAGARSSLRWMVMRPAWVRVGLALAMPLVATVAALPIPRGEATSTVAALIYLLAVVASALIGGLRGGLVSSVLSFLGLNFFFTPPFHTFKVEKPVDIVALFVFLVVSALVANLLAQALSQRERAEKREQETWLLYHLASRLLNREPLGGVLDEFAKELVRLFQLASCEVYIINAAGVQELAGHFELPGSLDSAPTVKVPLGAQNEEFGFVRLVPGTQGNFGSEEKEVFQAFAGQVGLAVESAMLQEKTRTAESKAETSRIRAALFSSVTHDLRTPLASIKAAATSLLDERVSFEADQRRDLLRTIEEESDRLNRLISNLLDLSRLRAGALIPEKTATPIEDVVESVVSRVRKHVTPHRLEVRIREGIPPVPIDVLQIDQVLSNLLENAARYSSGADSIEVLVRKWHSSVEIEVVDHGPGIAAGDRQRVFEEFYRSSPPGGDDGMAGTGLGLSIARAIVDAHGGEIWIHETPGGGATVGFRLPLETAADRA